MATKRLDLGRWNLVSLAYGGLTWVAVMLARLAGVLTMGDLSAILLLAVLVIVPLALPLATYTDGHPYSNALYQLAIVTQPFAALFASIALVTVSGTTTAAATALLWLLYTTLLGLIGLTTIANILLNRHITLSGVCLGMALAYLPIGGAWLALACLRMQPLGFSPTTVLLTAVHFHFITMAALVITGRIGLALHDTASEIAQNTYRIAAVVMLICPLLVAAGITFTQLTGQRAIESVGATLLALSLMAVVIISLRFIVPSAASPLARVLLAFSGFSVLLTMALAAAYALGTATHTWTITVPQMIAVHGWLNALAFGLCGLLGWRLKMAENS